MKVLLKKFHLNGNTRGFHHYTQKLELNANTWYHVTVLG